MCFYCKQKYFQFKNTCFDHLCGNECFVIFELSYKMFLPNAFANIFVHFLEYCLGEAASGNYALRWDLQFITHSRSNLLKEVGNGSWDSLVTVNAVVGVLATAPALSPVLAGWTSSDEYHKSRIKWCVILMSQASYNIDLFIVTRIFWGLWVNNIFFFLATIVVIHLRLYGYCSVTVANVYSFIILTLCLFQILHVVNEKVSPLDSLCLLLAFRIKRNPINHASSSSASIGLWDHCVTFTDKSPSKRHTVNLV